MFLYTCFAGKVNINIMTIVNKRHPRAYIAIILPAILLFVSFIFIFGGYQPNVFEYSKPTSKMLSRGLLLPVQETYIGLYGDGHGENNTKNIISDVVTKRIPTTHVNARVNIIRKKHQTTCNSGIEVIKENDDDQSNKTKEETILNPSATYSINKPKACTERKIDVVIPVHSAITNFKRREVARKELQGRYAKRKQTHTLMIFFVGLPSNSLKNVSAFQNKLWYESKVYNDIIQININDTYKNLAHKATAVLQWLATYCANTELVLKIDDDVRINPLPMLDLLYRHKLMTPDFVVGHRRSGIRPQRSKESQWYVSCEEFPNATYPKFVFGPAIGYSTSTVIKLYQKARRTKMIWLDDVFVTGICREKLGIPIYHSPQFLTMRVHYKRRIPDHFVYE